MSKMWKLILKLLLFCCVVFVLILIPFTFKKPKNSSKELFILGSGGHIREMIQLLDIIKPKTPQFLHAESDQLSKTLLLQSYPNA